MESLVKVIIYQKKGSIKQWMGEDIIDYLGGKGKKVQRMTPLVSLHFFCGCHLEPKADFVLT